MRRMSKLASILDKSILADDEGNIETKKDVKIDGNLKFKSLVSNDNPDGIFDPSSGGTGGGGGGKLYRHSITFLKPNFKIYFDVYSTIPQSFTFTELNASIRDKITCTGLVKVDTIQGQAVTIYYKSSTKDYQISYIDTNGEGRATWTNEGSVSLYDYVTPVE